MHFLDYRTGEVEYDNINRTLLDGNVTNMSLIFSKGNYGATDEDDTSCHGYYIIIFYSSPYTLQEYLNLYRKLF